MEGYIAIALSVGLLLALGIAIVITLVYKYLTHVIPGYDYPKLDKQKLKELNSDDLEYVKINPKAMIFLNYDEIQSTENLKLVPIFKGVQGKSFKLTNTSGEYILGVDGSDHNVHIFRKNNPMKYKTLLFMPVNYMDESTLAASFENSKQTQYLTVTEIEDEHGLGKHKYLMLTTLNPNNTFVTLDTNTNKT